MQDSKDLTRWKLAVSYLHTELARQSNSDTFEMGMVVGLVIGQTHGKALMRGLSERLQRTGTDPQKLSAVARRALAATAPLAPGEYRHVPKGYRLLPDNSLVPIDVVEEEKLQRRFGTAQAVVTDRARVNARADLEAVLDQAEVSHPIAGPSVAQWLRGMLPNPMQSKALQDAGVIGAPTAEPGTLSIMDAD
jgi:hypothetical protein